MKVYILPVVFQIFGVLVVVAEVFIPSMGLLTAIALGLIGYSLYLAFTTISSAAFFVFLGADLVVLPPGFDIGVENLSHFPLALKKKLSSGDGVVSQAQGLERYLNKKGRSLTVLRPSGTAVIDDVRLDVVTDGEYIEAQVPVQVTGVTGNQVVVARIG